MQMTFDFRPDAELANNNWQEDLRQWATVGRYMRSDPPSKNDLKMERDIRKHYYRRLHHALCRIVTAMLDPEYPMRAIQRRFKPRTDPDVAVEA